MAVKHQIWLALIALGDPTQADQKLGWQPKITARAMCAEMVAEDLKTAWFSGWRHCE